MSEALAKAMLQSQLVKVQQLRPYANCSPEELQQHKEVLYGLFGGQFQRQLGLLTQAGRSDFCNNIQACLPKCAFNHL